jgi:hypothetical protein
VKEQAELISQRGNYRVLVPDLYKGKIGVNAEEAKHVRRSCFIQPQYSANAATYLALEEDLCGYTELINETWHRVIRVCRVTLKQICWQQITECRRSFDLCTK